jgi:DnaJ-class molecular chaperone
MSKPCPRKTCSTWYEVLGVPIYANGDQITDAYQQLAEEWNPDRLQTRDEIISDGGFSETQMKWFNAAYAVLMNPVEREQHDAEILTRIPQAEWVN